MAGVEPESAWCGDLAPIAASDWNPARARHLLNRAGFGGTPEDVRRLSRLSPEQAVAYLIDCDGMPPQQLCEFEHSGLHDPSLSPFPPTRPAATEGAARTGQSMGVPIKPAGLRRLQPVTNRWFFWVRASTLESRRVANWWAGRMLVTNRPFEEKMALFWHGHFASSEEKVRDYRKMLGQIQLFQTQGRGSFRDLLHAVARDPAMLVFLDAGQNLRDAPNENFGREIMEMFTMGVGHYTETDIREAARAFTGWRDDDLGFRIDATLHDERNKQFLGRTGPFGGDEVIDIILEQPVTATYIASKIYRFFVRDELSAEYGERLGSLLRDGGYDLGHFMRTLFLSRDFYSDASQGAHIMGPTELIVSTYRRLGMRTLPGIPDFNATTTALGQTLLNPPTVAGWAPGRAWITPGTLLMRGNFARDVLLPDMIEFTDPNLQPLPPTARVVNAKLRAGLDVSAATRDGEGEGEEAPGKLLSAAEQFNTHLGSLKGWEEASRRVLPILRDPARFSLTDIVWDSGARDAAGAVDVMLERFLTVPLDAAGRTAAIAFLVDELGTDDLAFARPYAEEPLRLCAHLIMSTPEYQLA